eukprot:1256322-Amphidinium_carterae.1
MAVESNCLAIEMAAEELWRDRQLMEFAVRQDYEAHSQDMLRLMSDDLLEDESFLSDLKIEFYFLRLTMIDVRTFDDSDCMALGQHQ